MIRPDANLKRRIVFLRWALPLVFAISAAAYQLGPARWVHNFNHTYHFAIEIMFYSTVGPLLAFWAMTLIGRWLDQKDQAEIKVRQSQQRLASITSASADAILSLDAQGKIESWNHGAELIFGYRAEEMRGRMLSNLFGGGEAASVEFHWLLENVQRAGFLRGHETTCWNAEGQQVAVELTVTQLTDEAGQFLGMSVILRDITERNRRSEEIRRLNISLKEQVEERTRELAKKIKELEQANAELQKLDRMRSEFVSLVSHQIRAPLTNMHGAVVHIDVNCKAMNTTCVRMLGILNQQIERLDSLVRDVLNAARIESGDLVLQPEPISVLPVVQQVTEQTRARNANRTIQLPAKPGLPLVLADRNRVAEVLANLLDNADKYSPPDKDIVVDVRADQTEVTVSVRDYGPGLPADELEHVFDKYHRVDNSDSQAAYGYGLGLYVCHRLVEANGGRIWAENHPGGGAVFSFTLPVVI